MSHPNCQDELQALVQARSKHSDYQSIHASVLAATGPLPRQSGRWELERAECMFRQLSPRELEVLDIGANTGYFTFACLEAGARRVVSYEGNAVHARVLELSAQAIGADRRVEVRPAYYDFEPPSRERFQLALCLNVLHHLGDDFGNRDLGQVRAKQQMLAALRAMSARVDFCWLQLGFNWKGSKDLPLFRHGLKEEILEFVRTGVEGHWKVEFVAVFDPGTLRYEPASSANMARFDHLGEFRNRPLLLLRSAAVS